MTSQLESILDDIIQGEQLDDKGIISIDNESIQIKSQSYQVAINYREGFQLDAFKHRYQDYFEKFDFIVGDWASDMLRLRGFFQIGTRKVPRDQQIDFLDDYLKEYCNFGAAYFVLAKTEALDKFDKIKASAQKSKKNIRKVQPTKSSKVNISTPSPTNDNEHKMTVKPVKPKRNFKKSYKNNKSPQQQEKATKKGSKDHKFVIKKVKKT